MKILLPRFEDVEAAAKRIAPFAVRTPLLEYPALNERCGGRVLIKPEMLQRTGSFKFRGAYNKLTQIPADRQAAGVIAWSSGNHAQGVAAAARLLDMPATIVMPEDAPQVKIDGTRALGAKIVFFDRYSEDREQIGRTLADEQGATIVPSYDDPDIIAGQGTLGLEIAEDLKKRGLDLDRLALPCGGGGLSSGAGLAIRQAFPDAAITLVEPKGYDDYGRSLASGQRQTADVSQPNICDALLTPSPGKITFALNQQNRAKATTVSEQEVREAMTFAFKTLKLAVEPGGAVALAALLSGRFEAQDRTTALVLSGGNVDPDHFVALLTES